MITRRGVAGLTLIELMVAVAISVIIASVAYPSFKDQISKGRRAEGQAVLTEAGQWMERCATENLRYDQSRAGVAVALPSYLLQAPKEGTSKFYTISLQSVAQDTYTLKAVPTGVFSNDACGTLTVNNLGTKTAARSDCWKR